MPRAYCYLLAFLAGSSGLVFQVVWARQFAQVFGATVQASAVVLATFLGGLALGALFLGKLADRTRYPLRLAAWLVVLSSVLAAGGISALSSLSHLLDRIPPDAWSFAGSIVLFRIVVASLFILPPTILLGGMAPAMVRAVATSPKLLRPSFSTLFAVETFGGSIGAMSAGFGLIAAFGLHATLWLTASVTIILGAAIAWISRNAASLGGEQVDEDPSDQEPRRTAMGDHWLLAGVGLAGFAVLGMEVSWTRLLLLLLGGDTYAYTIVVSSFLLGLAGGGLVARWVTVRLTQPLATYAWLQIAAAIASLFLLAVIRWLAGGIGQKWLATFEGDWGAVLGGRFALCFAMLLIPSTLAGLSFPIAASHFLRRRHHLGRRTGQLYAASAAGNVIGALATGFVLIATIGLQSSVVALAAITLLAAGCFVVSRSYSLDSDASEIPSARPNPRKGAWVQAALIVVGLLACVTWRWSSPVVPLAIDGTAGKHEVIYYSEGLAGSVAVLRNREAPNERVMSIDGIIIGESHGGVDEKQRMLAHLPFLLQPEESARHIYTIGLGTGILAGEMVHQSDRTDVICVELSPEVIEGAKQFADLNRNLHDHPRGTLVAGDGMAYLRQSKHSFDAIISDGKSRPGYVGNVVFYSADFYGLCRKRLGPGGLMAQWVSLETPEKELRTILHTFVQSFPHSYVGIDPPDSLYLVGMNQPLQIDAGSMQRHLDSPSSAKLREYGWRNACDVLGMLAADGDGVKAWLRGDESLNTLDHPVIEFQALDTFRTPVAVRKQENLVALLPLIERPDTSMLVTNFDDQWLANCRESARILHETIVLLGENRLAEATTKLEDGLRLTTHHTRLRDLGVAVYFDQATAAEMANDRTSAIFYYRKVSQTLVDEDASLRWKLAVRLRKLDALYDAAGEYYTALKHDSQNVDLRLEFALLLTRMHKPAQAIRQLKVILQTDPDRPKVHLTLGLTFHAQNDSDLAHYHLTEAIKRDPAMREVVDELGIDLDHSP